MNKNNKIIIGVLAFIVAITIGYALFSDKITITGTAKAKGDFNIEIISASITSESGSKGATATVIDNGNKLSIEVPHLEYPGAYVDVTYNIKNSGTIDAVYNGYTIIGETDKIKSSFELKNLYYAPEEIKSETIRIYWDELNNDEAEETATIILEIYYNQVADKVEACNNIKLRAQIVEECEVGLRDGDECNDLGNDLNHDGWLDSNDSSNFYEIINSTLKCPSE